MTPIAGSRCKPAPRSAAPRLPKTEAQGHRIGGLTARFHGVPTNRSQRHTLAVDAPEILARCREDGADAAVLVANCPVCHQTLSLVARTLEAAGLPTVLMGAAKDIVELCGVPRFLFSDVPLGSAAGLPNDPASQDATTPGARPQPAGDRHRPPHHAPEPAPMARSARLARRLPQPGRPDPAGPGPRAGAA